MAIAEEHWGAPSPETIAHLRELSASDPPARRFVAVIVHYENPDEVKELVASIQFWSEKPEEVIIADNSHPKFSWQDAELPGIPVTIVPSPGNPGYGRAANLAIATISPEISYVLLLTQDTRLGHNSSQMLLDTLRSDPYAAVAGPALVYRSKPDTFFSLGGTLSRRGETSHLGLGAPVSTIPPKELRTKSIDWVDGACLMMRIDVFNQLSGFDPAYFLYVEEVDYQFRVRLAGHKILINRNCFGAQEPGHYSWWLRRKNHLKLTRKFSPYLRRWSPTLYWLGKFRRRIKFCFRVDGSRSDWT